jgi:hypothetical protein
MTSNLVLFVVLMTLDDVKLGSASKGYSSKVAAALVVRREDVVVVVVVVVDVFGFVVAQTAVRRTATSGRQFVTATVSLSPRQEYYPP